MPKFLFQGSYYGDGLKVVLCDLPDIEAAAAFSLAINNSGAARGHVTALLSPEEMDVAVIRSPAYRAPGKT